MPFLLRKLHIAETHKILLPLASTQGICPHQHHTGFFLSQLLIFKGTRRTNCLTNLKVRGILFSDVLIRLHIPGRWSATARTWPDVELPFRGRSRLLASKGEPAENLRVPRTCVISSLPDTRSTESFTDCISASQFTIDLKTPVSHCFR